MEFCGHSGSTPRPSAALAASVLVLLSSWYARLRIAHITLDTAVLEASSMPDTTVIKADSMPDTAVWKPTAPQIKRCNNRRVCFEQNMLHVRGGEPTHADRRLLLPVHAAASFSPVERRSPNAPAYGHVELLQQGHIE